MGLYSVHSVLCNFVQDASEHDRHGSTSASRPSPVNATHRPRSTARKDLLHAVSRLLALTSGMLAGSKSRCPCSCSCSDICHRRGIRDAIWALARICYVYQGTFVQCMGPFAYKPMPFKSLRLRTDLRAASRPIPRFYGLPFHARAVVGHYPKGPRSHRNNDSTYHVRRRPGTRLDWCMTAGVKLRV